ncbi:MAG TPA: DNA-binding domain-containing protein [Burkholderiales bacterium]|nr:DNA-binding domain-containing protein [Burkholderiales bacterium]
MKALDQLQREFQGYVLRGDQDVVEHVVGDGRVDPQRRLRIYADAYRLRLIDVLATDYEALRALLGDQEFRAASAGYVMATPSEHRNVRWYGAGLPEFLRTTQPWAQNAAAHEVALFEWTLTLAFDAADDPVVRFEDLAQLPSEQWPTLGFVLHSSVQLIQLRTNAPAMRKASDAQESLPEVVVEGEPRSWLIWRKDLTPCFRSLGEHEAWALSAIRAGADFTALCEGLCEWFPPEDAAPQAAALLRQWVDDELISALSD